MKTLAILILAVGSAFAQTPARTTSAMKPEDVQGMALRVIQLMESTAVAVPGLTQASAPVKQNTEATLQQLQRIPLGPAATHQLIGQIRAYLALVDSFPRPDSLPEVADQQFAELREDVARLERHFEALLQMQNTALRARDADPAGRNRYADADRKVLPPGATSRVVFLGDSITEGWRLNEYFTGRDFINRGITSQSTLQMIGRFLQDVVSLKPKAVLIQGGVNDIADGVSPASITDNFVVMAELAKAHGIKPIFASVMPVNSLHKGSDPRTDYEKTVPVSDIRSVNQWLQDFCKSQGYVYVDYFTALADGAGHTQTDFTDDGLHPNSKGYRVMSPVALDAINKAVGAGPDTNQQKKRFPLSLPLPK